jgi:Cys-tRNA synthase (O-phospho-L-seryl-tRNA:Cys-tRNA synthase)
VSLTFAPWPCAPWFRFRDWLLAARAIPTLDTRRKRLKCWTTPVLKARSYIRHMSRITQRGANPATHDLGKLRYTEGFTRCA